MTTAEIVQLRRATIKKMAFCEINGLFELAAAWRQEYLRICAEIKVGDPK